MPDTDMPVTLLPDGRVRLALDGKTGATTTLRRPRVGELRVLHEALEQTNDEVRDLLHAHPEKPVPPVRPPGQDDAEYADAYSAYAEARDEWRNIDRKATIELDERRGAWSRQVVEMLGDKPLPAGPVADLPTWAVDTRTAVALVNHWQNVPLDHGGR